MEDKLSMKVTENVIKANLQAFKNSELDKHYDFTVEATSLIKNLDDFTRIIKENKPIQFRITEDNALYYLIDGEATEELFDIDVTLSFSKSDVWLYDKLIQVAEIFPNASSTSISDDMTNCYVYLVIASVFVETFEDELLEFSSNYNFELCEPSHDGAEGSKIKICAPFSL